ncbi:hypothetical protein Tco_0273726 [Tanacetum coccineum]
MDTELVEGSEVRAEAEIAQESSSKRAGTELEQESIKKQKVDEDKETAELQRLIEVVPDKEEVAIDAIPLATKPPSIVDYKIHKEGKKTYYQIIRADGSSKMYLVFSHMLKSFDREDLETLWKLGDLKTMFDPHVEDQVWRNQQDYRVLDWKLYDSCGVHSLRKQNVHIHMLVEKRYPLTYATITDMLNRKLQADHWNEMIRSLEVNWDQQVVSELVALRNFEEDMDQDSSHMVAASKVPMLKPKNGNASPITKVVEGVETTIAPTTIEEKAQRRLELKARSTLLMGIPNEHQSLTPS